MCLSFDDGPAHPSTPVILDNLSQVSVKATFFC
ncbi:MAG: polysaccharide deacetylase family protein [Saprospiraceae bacterium]